MAATRSVPALGAEPNLSSGVLNAGVIEQARRRQQRRRARRLAVIALSAIAAGALTSPLWDAQHPSKMLSSRIPGPEAPLVAAAAVLSQDSYMGVSCATPNTIGCDRVGLAIWLKRPAISVDATIAGRPLKLNWAGDRPPRLASHKPRTAFDGFLQPAGLTTRLHVKPTATSGLDPACACPAGSTWLGDNAPSPVVQLQIQYPNRHRVATQLHVPLNAGWG